MQRFKVRLVSRHVCVCSRDLFYVRNHLPVPEVDPTTYELEVSGVGMKDVTLKLDDIKKFPKYTVTAAIQCAGNRRSEMSQVSLCDLRSVSYTHLDVYKRQVVVCDICIFQIVQLCLVFYF